jgi:hypothetical protein
MSVLFVSTVVSQLLGSNIGHFGGAAHQACWHYVLQAAAEDSRTLALILCIYMALKAQLRGFIPHAPEYDSSRQNPQVLHYQNVDRFAFDMLHLLQARPPPKKIPVKV